MVKEMSYMKLKKPEVIIHGHHFGKKLRFNKDEDRKKEQTIQAVGRTQHISSQVLDVAPMIKMLWKCKYMAGVAHTRESILLTKTLFTG